MRVSTEPRSPAYVSLRARPVRIGVLVPEVPQLAWQSAFAGALSSQARIWGGIANLLLPLRDGLADSELFWALVELWDPDWYDVYAGSHRELEDLDPARYRAWRDGEMRAYLEQLPQPLQQSDFAPLYEDPLVETDLPDELDRLLVRRGAALHYDGRLLPAALLSATGAPPYPATDVLELQALPQELFQPEISDGPTERLLAAAEFGALSPDLREQLDARGVRLRSVRPGSRNELLRWVYSARPPEGAAPFALSELGLRWFQPYPVAQRAVTVVTGEDAWDFALAYALRRTAGLAFWMPESIWAAEDERQVALGALTELTGRGGLQLVITSATDEQAAEALARQLPTVTSRSIVVRLSRWQDVLPQRSNRPWVDDSIGLPEPLYLEDGATPALRTPIPRVVEPTDATQIRWITEVQVRDWGALRHPASGNGLLDPSDSTEVRASAEGLAYIGPRGFVMSGVPLEYQTARPVLRPLSLLDQLQAVARDARWTCELSEKGQYALASADLFGGFEELCGALRDTDVERLLCAYLDADPEAPGKALTDRRRYLSLEEIESLSLSRPAELLLSDLEAGAVLTRGVVLKCPRCRHTAWYRARDIDPTFVCTRCSAAHRPDRAGWLEEPEPRWRYPASTRSSSSSCTTAAIYPPWLHSSASRRTNAPCRSFPRSCSQIPPATTARSTSR